MACIDTMGDWILDNDFGPSCIIKSSRILKSNHVCERFQISNRWIDHRKHRSLQIKATISPCWMLNLLDLSVWKSSWSRSWKLTGHEGTHQKCAAPNYWPSNIGFGRPNTYNTLGPKIGNVGTKDPSALVKVAPAVQHMVVLFKGLPCKDGDGDGGDGWIG